MKVFYDDDSSLESLKNKKVGIVGFGIQGRAQALNLRDSGIEVLIGNRADNYNKTALDDGFTVLPKLFGESIPKFSPLRLCVAGVE